jgi:hypothetical protein
MAPTSLDDIIPETTEFELKSTGKTYRLRGLSLEDQVWMRRTFGEKDLQLVFSDLRWEKISMIVFRLLEDKSDFLPYESDEFDDEGTLSKRRVTGPEHLLKKISGTSEGIKIVSAVNRCVINSNPMIEEAFREEIKKKMIERQTGERSSISSPVSTDGVSNTSEVVLQERYRSHSKPSTSERITTSPRKRPSTGSKLR